ncbi:hypothetical protein NDU88_007248 [Pleurodeles waltl]|uniref:Uncharacterized protein n=1 Tax=Pleurodeles waltl TaxID=8319 RepID=A0AAV7PNG1_PLEWA|nr:hypothetical protein NDU88_007248 [Pleurodeles waltl]
MDSARTTRARNFPFGGWMFHVVKSRAEVFSCRKNANKPCYLQRSRLGFLGAAVAQEGPGCRQLREETEGASSKTKSPLRSKQHPQKCRNRHYKVE